MRRVELPLWVVVKEKVLAFERGVVELKSVITRFPSDAADSNKVSVVSWTVT